MKWRDLEGTVARMFDKGDVRGFRKQDIILGPGEALILIEEGKISEVLTQTRIKDMGGGFKNWLIQKIGMGKDMVFLFVDTRQFEVETPFRSNSKDFVQIHGTITTKLQINTNEATKLLNFMREYMAPKYREKGIFRKRQVFDGFETRGQSLTREDILEKLMQEMQARVFDPVIARHEAAAFHGDTRVVADLRTEATVSLRKTLDMWGITLQDLYARFGETEFIRAQQYAAQKRLESMRDDADFDAAYIKDSERRGELYKTQVAKMEEAATIRFAKERERRLAEQGDSLERERMEDEQDTAALEKMIALKELMKDQKIREFQEVDLKGKELDVQKAIELARIEAEKAKHDLRTYQEAEDRERGHQERVIDRFSQFMGTGTGAPPSGSGGAGGSGSGADEGERICLSCGMKIRQGWKACPHCGKKV